MQILSTTGGTINFIPREDIDVSKTYTITIFSENENKVHHNDTNPTINSVRFYNTYATSQTFIENAFYTIEVTNTTDSKLIFRDKIFCTNQTATEFEISNGVFTEHNTGSNEYIYYS